MFTLFIIFLLVVNIHLVIYLLENVFVLPIHVGIIYGSSIIIGLILTVFIVWVLLQLFYLLLPKEKIQHSLFMHQILKQITSVPLHLMLIRVKVVGKEHLPKDTGFSIYSNHVSWYDPILISYGLYNYKVMALGKEGAFQLPVVGKYAPLFGSVMIHRDDPRQSARAIKTVIERVNDGFPMIIFPEGTRNKEKELLEFKAGAFKVALKSKKPLVPITLVEHKRKIWKKIVVHIHKPIAPDEFKDMNSHELAIQVKSIVDSKR